MCFSDFNSEVIEQVTMPNVRLNVPDHYWDRAGYYSGDWSSLSPLLEDVSLKNFPRGEMEKSPQYPVCAKFSLFSDLSREVGSSSFVHPTGRVVCLGILESLWAVPTAEKGRRAI